MEEKPEVFVYQTYQGYYPEGGASDIYAYSLNVFDVIEEALVDIFERTVNPVPYYERFSHFHEVVSLLDNSMICFQPRLDETLKAFNLRVLSPTKKDSWAKFAEKLFHNFVEDYSLETLGYTARIEVGG